MWLSKCGGNGGRSWSGSANTQKIAVRSGSRIDNFNGRGGNGGGKHMLDCGPGFKISGYKMRCGALVDRVQFRCSGGLTTTLAGLTNVQRSQLDRLLDDVQIE